MPVIKNKIRLVTVFFVTLFFLNQKINAANDILFSSFFAEKNLSSKNITCFFQDSKGYMWIGTQDGLNYFNGKTIKSFKHDYLNKNSLPDNEIGSIAEDENGNLWIGTSRGISKLNTALLTFENYFMDSKEKPLGYKTNIYIDKENNVWAFSAKLFCLNSASNQFEEKPFSKKKALNTPYAPRLLTGIFEDSKKRYWLSTSENLYCYFPQENLVEEFTSLKKETYFFSVREDAKGNLFCGTWHDGLYIIDSQKHQFETIEGKGLHGHYTCQQLGKETLLWYGNSLTSFNLNTHTLDKYKSANTNYSPKNDEVSALLVDAQNQLWIGYGSKGIQIVSPSNQIFKTYSIAEKENMFPTVTSFIKTPNYTYVGSWYNYSLARLDKNYKPIKTWKTLIPHVSQNENNISDAWSDAKGTIWFSSGYGLIKFDEATEKTDLYRMDTSMSKKNHFLQVLPEGDSVLWLAGYFCGLSRFSIKAKTFQNWGASVRSLYWGLTRDKAGIIWLADNSGVLTGFNPLTKTFIQKEYRALTEDAIYNSIIFDSIGNALWIACNNGLLKVDCKTFSGKLFTEKDNLPTNQINAVQFDDKHKLWIATNKGLCFYDEKQNVFKTFFSNNGLPSNVLSQLFKIEKSGELIIGCTDGFSVLQTNAALFDNFVQTIAIDKVYESGKIVLVKLFESKKTIDLNYDQNNIQIEFSSNDLINSEDNQLLFKLEGYDDSWHTAQNGIVNYSKLAPGKYLFHVTGINHSGIKSKRDDYLVIFINPPFWKTTWFILLISFLFFCLTLLAARYVFTRNLREKILILEKEQAVEKERNRISQDMHDELGSGLTKISIMSEVAMMQITNADKTKNQLENISNSSRLLVDNLQDIIWVLNSKNDSLENLCAYIQEYALKYFEPLEIHVLVDFPEKISDTKLSEDQRRNILLVFKEAFHNISKHSACSNVALKMAETTGYVSFEISDNGKGFDKNAIRNFANGLHNMNKRMMDINGSFDVQSVLMQGTYTSFKFKV